VQLQQQRRALPEYCGQANESDQDERTAAAQQGKSYLRLMILFYEEIK